LAPTVGIFEPTVSAGDLIAEGVSIGTVEVLGVRHALIVPETVAGRVAHIAGDGRTRAAVQYGDALITVSTLSSKAVAKSTARAKSSKAGSLSFVAPMSGRFYGRPSPGDPPFVTKGDAVKRGQTVGLLEVMKTFNRLVYEGDDLPEQATVAEIVPNDGDDVVRGDVILALTK
jgi:acetyl-CoA carboxylase biotin carboxyl carrier protein